MATRIEAVATQVAEEIEGDLVDFLAEHPGSLLLEEGEILFDLAVADHTVTCTQGRVVLHIWSEQRNQVRRIVSAVRRGGTLRLMAQRFGQKEPQSLELVAECGRRAPATRDGERRRYLQLLRRVLEREFPESTLADLRATIDLEHSFGPAYVRGLQVRGSRAWAVIGVAGSESPAMIDGLLTIGLLWLAYCREHAEARRVVEGLRLILPVGMAMTTLARVAWLDERVAKYAVHELNEATETLLERDASDCGNLATRLVRAPNEVAATQPEGRFSEAIPRVLALIPQLQPIESEAAPAAHSKERWLPVAQNGFEMRLRSNAELVFLRYGLEFARIRAGFAGESFNRSLEVTVGSGAQETVLTEANAGALRAMVHELFARRSAGIDGRRTKTKETLRSGDTLFRAQPERWLEGLLRADIGALDPQLQAAPVYVQVPAIAGAGDRGMLDLLAVTRDHRLAVIEVKAEEDLHFAMQGLDYWIRVREHHLAHVDPATGLGDLQQHGYFPETRLQAETPLLFLVAPALRIHSATETVLRFLDPRVQWTVIALDERWRTKIRPVWRKRSRAAETAR